MLTEQWFFYCCIVFTLTTLFCWISFGRISVKRIEAKIQHAGLSRPCSWDETGARIILYAYCLTLPNVISERIDKRVVDASLIKKYGTTVDQLLGRTLVVTSNILISLIFIGWLILDLY
jgi:hypothetical protein